MASRTPSSASCRQDSRSRSDARSGCHTRVKGCSATATAAPGSSGRSDGCATARPSIRRGRSSRRSRRRLERQYPEPNTNVGLTARPLHEAIVGQREDRALRVDGRRVVRAADHVHEPREPAARARGIPRIGDGGAFRARRRPSAARPPDAHRERRARRRRRHRRRAPGHVGARLARDAQPGRHPAARHGPDRPRRPGVRGGRIDADCHRLRHPAGAPDDGRVARDDVEGRRPRRWRTRAAARAGRSSSPRWRSP